MLPPHGDGSPPPPFPSRAPHSASGAEPDLGRRTLVSGGVVFGVRTLQAALLVGASIVLARLLTPEDFGVFAMVVPMGTIAAGISGHAVQTAILQRTVVDARVAGDALGFAVPVALLTALGMVAAGIAFAAFYQEPRVVAATAAWAAVVAILSPVTVREALLKRDLRFPEVLGVQLVAMIVGIACSIGAALAGAGHWALVIQILVMEAVRGVGIFMLPGERPTIHWKRLGGSPGASDLRSLWLSLVGLRAAAWLGDLPDLVLVGRMETTFVLGTYDTARRWARYFFEEPFLALTDVAIAGLRPVARASERFRELAGNAVLAMMTASLPALSFVAIEADALVRVVLGEQWLRAIPLLRVLALAAALAALSSVARWIYLATGRTQRLVRWSVFVRFPVMAVAAMVGTLGGAYGVAVAVAIASGVLVVPTVWYSVRETPVTTHDMLRWAARPAACSVGAAAMLILAHPLLDPTGVSRLLKAGVLHGAAFAVLWHLAPGGLRDTRALIRTLRRAER